MSDTVNLGIRYIVYFSEFLYNILKGSRRDVVANVLDCDILVNKFELQSHHYLHWGKAWTPLALHSFGLTINDNNTLLIWE